MSQRQVLSILKEKGKKDYGAEGDMYNYVGTSGSFFCKIKQQAMYPAKCERKGWVKKYPETFEGEVRMPSECDQYEFEYEGVN